MSPVVVGAGAGAGAGLVAGAGAGAGIVVGVDVVVGVDGALCVMLRDVVVCLFQVDKEMLEFLTKWQSFQRSLSILWGHSW